MKRSIRLAWINVFMAIFPCFGQSPLDGIVASVNPGPGPGEYTISCTVSVNTFPLTILAGHPYCGEEISRQERTQSDGTRTVQPVSTAIKCRDTSGRIRTERRPVRLMGMLPRIDLPIVPVIVDPVAGFTIYLDTVNRIAHRTLLPPESFVIISSPPNRVYRAITTKEKDLVRRTEPLGTGVINGIEAQGMRTTTIYPSGSFGNDRPLVATAEIWSSPELGLTIRSKNSDPRMGEYTTEVINIKRGNPDRSLFEVPRDYEIVDEPKVPFTFTISVVNVPTF